MCLSLQLFIERLKNSVPCSSLPSQRRKRDSQPSTRCFNKNAEKRNEIYQKGDFLRGTEGLLLTSSGCLLTRLVSSLNVVQVPWQRDSGCHVVYFVMYYISVAKFEEHCFNTFRDNFYSVFTI